MALMFAETENIKKAVVLVNQLDDSKFPLLLNIIVQNIHVQDQRSFSTEEEEKLVSVLGLTASELDLVIQTLEFFLQQAAYYTAKPPMLQEQLEKLGLATNKIDCIVEGWTSHAREVVDKLRQRNIAPKKLEEINWRLNLQLSQTNKSRQKVPNAMFELVLGCENEEDKERLLMEFNHEELYAFYQQLETIQTQLDALS